MLGPLWQDAESGWPTQANRNRRNSTGQSERVVDAIRRTAADTEEDTADMAADEAMTRRALKLLGSKRNDAYEAALAALREDTQDWWEGVLARDPDELGEGEEATAADAEGLRHFIEAEVLPWFESRRKELANRQLIREQAFGDALDVDKLALLSQLAAEIGVSTAKNAKNASPIKATARKSRRSEDQVAFHVA